MTALGYIYDRGAASLRTQQVNTVGVLVTSVSNPLYAEFIDGLESRLASAGVVTIVANTGKDPQRQDELIRTLREQRVGGIAIAAAEGTEGELSTHLRELGMAHVFVGLGGDEGRSASVGFDDQRIGYLAARHLIDVHDCAKIAYVGGPRGYASRDERSLGILRAMRESGIDADSLLQLAAPSVALRGYELGQELLAQSERPDGIFCHTDMVALGLMRSLLDHAPDWNPPVMGNGDNELGTMFEPPLTTVTSDARLLGEEAARMLLEQLDDPHRLPEHFRPVPHVVVRRSCGCR